MTALIEAARAALELFDGPDEHFPYREWTIRLNALRTALAAAEAQPVGEPVAWLYVDDCGNGYRHLSERPPSSQDPQALADAEVFVTPLYTAPPAQPAAPAPLTDEQIYKTLLDAGVRVYNPVLQDAFIVAGRAIERAHGIGEGA